MKNEYLDLERKINSLPEPDYERGFTQETQNLIHENLINFASSYHKQKKRSSQFKKISLSLASIAAFMLFAILTIPIYVESPLSSDSSKPGQGSNGQNNADYVEKENDIKDSLPYENKEYGFVFSLPNSWGNYQIVKDSWEGSSANNKYNTNEHGIILLIRHPRWTEENPRQDIPIMIFTLEQWSTLEKGEFHIGAAPVNPTILGQNDKFVFALPARYNFQQLEGYEEVERILENNPLQSITNQK